MGLSHLRLQEEAGKERKRCSRCSYERRTSNAIEYFQGENKSELAVSLYDSIAVHINGLLSIIRATNDEIKAKKQERKPIVPCNLDYAVKQAMNPVEPWNAEEQAAGRNTLGLKSEKWVFELEDGTVVEKEVVIG